MGDNESAPVAPVLTRQLTSHLDQFVEELANLNKDNEEADRTSKKVSKADAAATEQFDFIIGEATDIGGGVVNQDAFDVFRTGEHQENLVMAVYDGHGRELGELAAIVSRDKIRALLEDPNIMAQVIDKPEAALTSVFAQAHEEIKKQFYEKYTKLGFQVQETPDGYLLKRKNSGSAWTCTHGGTTATVVLILGESNRMVVANVGDSTALFGGIDSNNDIVFQELSAEHSPESPSEFKRVRRERPDGSTNLPEMRFVYDSPSYAKNQCPPVFAVEQNDPDKVKITGNGNYYKNVRNEWATLVTTPPHARFQDALAFTRSLGDLHLHMYGVSSIPDVAEYDLIDFHKGASHNEGDVSCLLLCTDGVWDNWKYPDIVREAVNEEMLSAALGEGGSGQKATDMLMAANLKLARAHFGSSADNMTAIVLYIRMKDQV